MEIKRFGPGFRRPEGPPGTQGVTGQVIFRDGQAVVTELAFQRYAIVTPHSNATNTALFIVISGGGFVQVGDERARINHGEAVVWPPESLHGAYTDGTEMRVIIVELIADDAEVIDAQADPVAADSANTPPATSTRSGPTPGEGALADRQVMRDEYDSAEGEPW